MTNYCYRCNQTHPMERMMVITASFSDPGRWLDVCEDCVRLGDRMIDTMGDEEDFGPDSATQALERGPR